VVDSLTGLEWARMFAMTLDWQGAVDYCEATLNDGEYGGHDDWRLPAYQELQTLLDYSEYSPSIDQTAFPGTSGDFWSSSMDASDFDNAGSVSFLHSSSGFSAKTEERGARCVRGATTDMSASDRFEVDGSPGAEVVLDRMTGLEWHYQYVVDINWSAALAHCEGSTYGGHDDWRLPDVNELASLVDVTAGPATTRFPDTPQTSFWTSTTGKSSVHRAWWVSFNSGVTSSGVKADDLWCVRCVRGGL
jgi:hypothetical protein